MLITANQPFADWNKVFPDHAMMIAAIDRLVHHSIIFEMNVESFRRRGAIERKNRALDTPSKKIKEPVASCFVAPSDKHTRQSRNNRQHQTKPLQTAINSDNHPVK